MLRDHLLPHQRAALDKIKAAFTEKKEPEVDSAEPSQHQERADKNANFIEVARRDTLANLKKGNLLGCAETLYGLSAAISPQLKQRVYAAAKRMENASQTSFLKKIEPSEQYKERAGKVLGAFFDGLRTSKIRVGNEMVAAAATADTAPIEFPSVGEENAQHLIREIIRHGRVQGYAPVVPLSNPILDNAKVKKYFSQDTIQGYVLLKRQMVFGIPIHYSDSAKVDPVDTFESMLLSLNMRSSRKYIMPGRPQKWSNCFWQWVISEKDFRLLMNCSPTGHFVLRNWSMAFQDSHLNLG